MLEFPKIMKRKAVSRYPQTVKRRKTSTSTRPQQPVFNISTRNLEKEYDTNEYKVTDVIQGAISATAAGQVFDLMVNLSSGTGPINQFVGGKIQPVGIQFRYCWQLGDPTNVVRVIIFQWMDSTFPTTAGILASLNALAPVQLDNRENINILKDEILFLSDTGAGVCNGGGKIYIPAKRMIPCQFNRSTGAWQKGRLFCLAISDSAVLPSPTITFFHRLTFLDI